MSEKLHLPEREHSPEKNSPEILGAEVKEVVGNTETINIEKARLAIEQSKPISNEATKDGSGSAEKDSSNDFRWWSKELGSQTFDRTLSSVRRKLSIPERQLSKVIHKPIIEKVSEIGGKTVARPSGILLGGIFSFIGSLAVYLLSRHIGGELHYSVFAVTFVLGYLLGLIIELVWCIISRK